MYSVQHMKQSEIAEQFGVSQSAISYLTRHALGARPGRRVPHINPELPARMLHEADEQLEEEIGDLERVLTHLRATLAMLRQTPAETPLPADPDRQLAYLLQHPSP